MVDVSLCMVSLDCWHVLRPCLDSVYASDEEVQWEIIIVDNGSRDGTPELLRQHFPKVQVIENHANVGFTKATNQAIERSSGRYILWLNTDTLLKPDTLSNLVHFLEETPQAGIAGPKVLNPDGTFQPQCKRGMPTPFASLCYMLKLDRLLPHHPAVGQYLLTNLSTNHPHMVDAVSGCCLMARCQVWHDVGPLDEHIFAFGEDLDWCVRARQAGWQVWYYPASELIHIKGQGGVHSKPFHKLWGMHQGMWVFYRKHLMQHYGLLVTSVVWFGIIGSFLVKCSTLLARRLLQEHVASS